MTRKKFHHKELDTKYIASIHSRLFSHGLRNFLRYMILAVSIVKIHQRPCFFNVCDICLSFSRADEKHIKNMGTKVGKKKLVANRPLGRHFFPHVSLPALSRKARAASCPPNALEFDQKAAIVNLMLRIAQDRGLQTPCLQKYGAHTSAWRSAVSQYYGIDAEDAKIILTKAAFGFATSVEDKQEDGLLPFVQGPCKHFNTKTWNAKFSVSCRYKP